jgi:DNA topoisomerase-1
MGSCGWHEIATSDVVPTLPGRVAGQVGRRGTFHSRSRFSKARMCESNDMTSDPTEASEASPAVHRPHTSTIFGKKRGLSYTAVDALTIRRQRCGKGWRHIGPDGHFIRDRVTVARLAALAVPPAYREVRYAKDPAAHLQAVGRDAAGRLQYRYHREWENIREAGKAQRLGRLAMTVPRIRRRIGRHLTAAEPTRNLACAAVVDLVARTAIRPGGDRYARLHGTRGATTLLKSNVVVARAITLTFNSKGGKSVRKLLVAPRLANAIKRLLALQGRWLFQYRDGSGAVRRIPARAVNSFLCEIAACKSRSRISVRWPRRRACSQLWPMHRRARRRAFAANRS